MSEAPTLDPGEKLLWSGRPRAIWLALRRAGWPLLIAVFLLATCAALFDELKRLPRPPANPQTLHPAMVVGAFVHITAYFGLICLAAALWYSLRAFQTTYQLTNRRAVIDTAGPIPRRVSMPIEHLRFVEFRSRLLGPSDIIFSETRGVSLDGWGLRKEGFIAIADAKRVEGLVRGAIEQTFATRARGPWQ